jgi:hypothetical protein
MKQIKTKKKRKKKKKRCVGWKSHLCTQLWWDAPANQGFEKRISFSVEFSEILFLRIPEFGIEFADSETGSGGTDDGTAR